MPSTAQQLITELEASNAFRHVSLAIDAENVTAQSQIAGNAEAWVIEFKTDALQNSRDLGKPVQMERQLFAVIIAIKSVNDADGDKAVTALQDKRLAVRQKLYGFIPTSNNNSYQSLTLAGSRLLSFNKPVTFWVEIFQTSHQIDSENLI